MSESPNMQTLRETPITTRFNVAAFGCLGYELDLKYVSPVQRREIMRQIAFYKQYRRVFQYGVFWRGEPEKGNKTVWHCVARDQATAVTGFFQAQTTASEGFDRLRLMGLDPARRYRVATHPQSLFIRRFGGLVRHLLPFSLNPDGLALHMLSRLYALDDCVESYDGCGSALMSGVMLGNQFIGSGYNAKVRLLGDFGSNTCT